MYYSNSLVASGFKDHRAAWAATFSWDRSKGKRTRVIGAGNWNQKGTKLGSLLGEWPKIRPPRRAQGKLGTAQPQLRACLFIAQAAVTCAQVSKWQWNLERSRFGCEYNV
jgi:hypothetical protein